MNASDEDKPTVTDNPDNLDHLAIEDIRIVKV